jgi:hypothetical protein
MTTKKEVLAYLAKAEPKHLRDIRARCTYLLGPAAAGDEKEQATADVEEQVLYEAARAALSRGGTTTPPYSVFRRGRDYKAFQRGAGIVSAYVVANFGKMRRAERQDVYELLVRRLAIWLRAGKIMPLMAPVGNNLQKIPALIDEWFPGYRESGLLPQVLVALRKGTDV